MSNVPYRHSSVIPQNANPERELVSSLGLLPECEGGVTYQGVGGHKATKLPSMGDGFLRSADGVLSSAPFYRVYTPAPLRPPGHKAMCSEGRNHKSGQEVQGAETGTSGEGPVTLPTPSCEERSTDNKARTQGSQRAVGHSICNGQGSFTSVHFVCNSQC